MNENDILRLIQELDKDGKSWQKSVVVAMYLEIQRLKGE